MLPICRKHHTTAKALYLEPAGPGRFALRTEKVYVRDQKWQVRRDGRLVPLANVKPQPDALRLPGGKCESGDGGWWPSLEDFCRQHGVDPNAEPLPQQEERDAGPLAAPAGRWVDAGGGQVFQPVEPPPPPKRKRTGAQRGEARL